MDIEKEKTYDSVFWSSLTKFGRYFAPLVNEVFGEHFTGKAVLHYEPSKSAVPMEDGSFEQNEADSIAELTEDDVTKRYHFECQTWYEGSIGLRIAEYSAASAYSSITVGESGVEMSIPHSAIILLQSGSLAADRNKIEMSIKYPGGTVHYDVPIIRIASYSIDQIFEKKLFLLLPFWGFTFAGQFDEIENDPERIEQLRAGLFEIGYRLRQLVDAGEINENDRSALIQNVYRVLKKLTYKYVNISKGVDDIMGIKILSSIGDDLDEFYAIMEEKMTVLFQEHFREQAIAEGLAEGLEEGRAEGRELGLAQGREQGLAQGLEEGRAEGLEQGREQGLAQGLEEGREQGLAQGLEEGREQGLAQGLEEGQVIGMIKVYMEDMKLCESDIVDKIMMRFPIDETKAREYITKAAKEEDLTFSPESK